MRCYMKKKIMILTLIIVLLFSCFLPVLHPSASGKKPVFHKKHYQIMVGKSTTFKIKYMKKSYRVIYTSSNRNIASINKKTGRCVGKKSGKCTITAKIYDKKYKRISTIKQTLKVISSSLLPNASFHLIQSINPFDYTIKLGCSRILLKKEVNKSQIIIKKNGSSTTLSASFSGLSSDGKQVTYTMTSQSQKTLSPKDGTMNGNYTLSSSLFTNKLSLSYHERIGNQSLSGYVFSVEGNPINQAYIKCITDSSIVTCHTDKHGYYRLEKIKNPLSLTVSKQDYFSETLTSLTSSKKSTICENIILHLKNNDDYSFQIHVNEKSGAAISHAAVYLKDNKNSIVFTGETDDKGNIYLYTKKEADSVPCTRWYISEQESLSYEDHFSANTSNKKKLSALPLDKEYTLLIGKLPEKNLPGFEFRSISFCPKDYSTQHFDFHFTLSENRPVSLQNLSLDCNVKKQQNPSLLRLSFYQKENKKPVFDNILNDEYFSVNEKLLTFSCEIPCYLPDDAYYIKICLMDNKENIIYSYPITPITISNRTCTTAKISPLPDSFARILAYGDFYQTDITASFKRYQWVEGQYFYLDTLTTSPFQGKKIDTKTASLILPFTEPGITYLLVPERKTISGKNDITFIAEKNNIYTTIESALVSPSAATIECIYTSEILSSNADPGSSDTISIPIAAKHFTATKSYVRNCSSYPNSVTVFYKTDGTMLSAALTTSPSKNLDITKNHSIIMDIYTNGKELFTTQTNYSK